MEKTYKTFDEYKEYAKNRRNRSKIVKAYEKALSEYKKQNNIKVVDIPPLLNGCIRSDSANNPYSYMCQLTQGATDSDGVFNPLTNYYTIMFYSGVKGCTIYKAMNGSIHYKCFVCGNSAEPFGKNHWSAGCRVYENLEISEIVQKLVNKNWLEYKNIADNSVNIAFLTAMKQRLIKTLLYNKIIYKKADGKYEDYLYHNLIK